jgi:hypothetical protein
MAGIMLDVTTAEIATGTSAKTLMQIVAATNTRVLVHEWGIAFEGVSNTAAPIQVDLILQSDAGTSSALTPVKHNQGDDETLQTTARHTATVEPTGTTIFQSYFVHPQTGRDWVAPFGGAFVIKGGQRLGFRVTAAADVGAIVYARCEE